MICLTLEAGGGGLGSAGSIKTSLTKRVVIAGSLKFERSLQSGNKGVLRPCALKWWESAMSEAEYDRLLEAVKMAIEPAPL